MARGTWGGAIDPNIFRVNFLFLLGTSKCQMGFKVRDVAVQDNTAQEVADQARTVLEDPFRQMLKPTDSFLGVDVLKLGTEEGGWSPAVNTAGVQSTASVNAVPAFMACNVSLKSEIRKRYGQGRYFMPIVNEADVDGDILNVLGIEHQNAFITPLTANFTGNPATHDLLLVNAHGVLPPRAATATRPARPEIPASWYDVVSIRINHVVTSLRSRKAGVGS